MLFIASYSKNIVDHPDANLSTPQDMALNIFTKAGILPTFYSDEINDET
jgi:hypothetical protein